MNRPMAVVQKAGSGKRTIVLLGVLALTVGVAVWFLYFRQEPLAPGGLDLALGLVQAEKLNPNIGRELFDDPRFQRLKMYAKLPIDVGPTGRVNPFAVIGH